MSKENFNWDIPITYAPNTMYICKNEGIVIRNVDNHGVDWFVEDITPGDDKAQEKILSILN